MAEQHLTRNEFVTWAQRFEDKLDRVIKQDNDTNVQVEARLTFLETYQKQSSGRIAWISGVVGSIVAGAFLTLVTWLKE